MRFFDISGGSFCICPRLNLQISKFTGENENLCEDYIKIRHVTANTTIYGFLYFFLGPNFVIILVQCQT